MAPSNTTSTTVTSGGQLLKFTGANYFRQRLMLATLSAKTVRIDGIRPDDDHVGVTEHEVSFMKLLEKLTNGSKFEINYTGTSVLYRPGVLVGGDVEHDCGTDRSIGYFLEFLIALAPFSKLPFNLKLDGVTNDYRDPSVDLVRTGLIPHLKLFGIEDGVELKITRRGASPNGGGQVIFKCPIVRQLKPLQFTDEGRIKRIRGIAYCTRVSPQISNRLIESTRSLLNYFIPDVMIYSDVYKGAESGKSPGFGLTLVAESTTGALLSTECTAQGGDSPEDLGLLVAKQLYDQIELGGCCDTQHQWLMMLLMALCPEDVSKVRMGKLSPFSIQFLRDLRNFFGITFKIKTESEFRTTLSCLGVGFINLNKKAT